ncbi:MAG: MATE family efflux transporter [Muribaculaceae bacterium]|nr:MATE family efflux transporter [Muribaculaceae bacterium]MDE6643347.1 MATE family efflux transporter [Muribaculaceae bacterium]
MELNKKSINRQILALAVPSIIANITTPLLALVDTAIVGHMGSAMFIAAIALGGSVFNMIYWLFNFLRMGTSGITAQEFGRGADGYTSETLTRSLLIALTVGITLIILRHPIISVAINFMDPDPATADIARTYCYILIFGAPALLASYSFTGWFIGMQNSKATMWISLLINVTNIGASLLLVYWLNFGIKGVAFGTLTAQWTGAIAAFLMARLNGYRFKQQGGQPIFDRKKIEQFFSINFHIFLRTICLIAVTVWFTRTGARQGTLMLSVNALLMQFFVIFSYFMDGFAFAGEALTGKSIGAGDKSLMKLTVKHLFGFGVGLSILFSLLYTVGGDLVLNILSNEQYVLQATSDFRWWVVTVPLAGFSAFIWDGIYIGATQTKWMLTAVFSAMVVFFTILAIAYPTMGNHGLWLAFISYLIIRGLVLTLTYHKIERVHFYHQK